MVDSGDKCSFGRVCRDDAEFAACRVAPAADGAVLFVVELKDPACPYAMSFGDSHICTCPERRRIYADRKK